MKMKHIDGSWQERIRACRPYTDHILLAVGIIGVVLGLIGWQCAEDMHTQGIGVQAAGDRQAQELSLLRGRIKAQSGQGDPVADLIADCDDYHGKLIAVEEGIPQETDGWEQLPVTLRIEMEYLQLIELLAVWESGTPWREVHVLESESVAGGARTLATIRVVSYRYIGI